MCPDARVQDDYIPSTRSGPKMGGLIGPPSTLDQHCEHCRYRSSGTEAACALPCWGAAKEGGKKRQTSTLSRPQIGKVAQW